MVNGYLPRPLRREFFAESDAPAGRFCPLPGPSD
jgi:hypothetical protein